jgi:hypothetical protein
LRKAKGMTEPEALKTMKDPLFYGAMMVRKGVVDSFVGGATYTTADVCRASIQIVGMQPGLKTLSSFFAMILPDKSFGKDGVLFYGDGGVVIDPNVEQLADIAIATADSYASLVGEAPRVAMLSCSTKGSAKHPRIDKVLAAMVAWPRSGARTSSSTASCRATPRLIPSVGERKAKGSPVAGKANVLHLPGPGFRQHQLQAHRASGQGPGTGSGSAGHGQAVVGSVARLQRNRHRQRHRHQRGPSAIRAEVVFRRREMRILVVNCGSSSLKFKLYDLTSTEAGHLLAEGVVEEIGREKSKFTYKTHKSPASWCWKWWPRITRKPWPP